MARGRFVGKILVQGWDLKSRRLFCQSNVPVEPRFLEGLELRGEEARLAPSKVEQRRSSRHPTWKLSEPSASNVLICSESLK